MPKLVNKVVFVNGRRTSMRMCQREWSAFEEVCGREKISRNELLGLIEECKKDELGLTYSTRLFIISYFWNAATETGHANAGHSCNCGCFFTSIRYIRSPNLSLDRRLNCRTSWLNSASLRTFLEMDKNSSPQSISAKLSRFLFISL